MSGSRSTSPFPPSSASNKGGKGGKSETLSNDALYAPLSFYNGGTSTASSTADPKINNNNSNNKKKKSSHSLTLQTSTSLREPALLTFLTSLSANLKTSHPHEYQLYRGLGGSIARYGTGDNDRINPSTARNALEGKLSNRSLVLVGGGVHSHASAGVGLSGGTTSSAGIHAGAAAESGVIGLGMAQAAKGGRARKRTGGNGVFGSVSNKKRKKVLQRILCRSKDCSTKGDGFELQKENNSTCDKKSSASLQCDQVHDSQVITKNQVVPANTGTSSEKVGNPQDKISHVIETLHKMWLNYMNQLLAPLRKSLDAPPKTKSSTTSKSPSKKNIQTDSTPTTPSIPEPNLTLQDRQQVSLLLGQAEHVGMPATIIACPSRRHLVRTRCIVVNETKDMWQIAMMKSSRKKRSPTERHSRKQDASPWQIVKIPKRGTVLEVNLTLTANCNISVRLET